jgi:hypothetical protein
MLDPLASPHFRRLHAAVDTRPFLAELRSNAVFNALIEMPSVSAAVPEAQTRPIEPGESLRSGTAVAALSCPKLHAFLQEIAGRRSTMPGQAWLLRLPAGSSLCLPRNGDNPHCHFILAADEASPMGLDRETRLWCPGEVWWLEGSLGQVAALPAGSHRLHAVLSMAQPMGLANG